MVALVLAETNRLLSRRMTRFFPLVLAAFMILGIVIAILIVSNEDTGGVNFVDDIVAIDEDFGGASETGTDVLGPMGFLIPIMAFVVGASYFGADEKVGMIEHLLTWEPRRWRLLLARAIGGAFSLFAISTLLSAFLVVLLFILSAATGGDTSGFGDVAGEVIGAIVRSGISGGLFFLIGLGMTVLINNSIASIVGFLIWVFVIELALVGGLLPRWTQWLPVSNSTAFVPGRQFTFFPGPFEDSNGTFEPIVLYGATEAGIRILVWGVVFIALGAVAFTRRDID